ncbi:endonuclease domain-containing protein [Desulfotalea psychrophila]|uniref:DUF559 domain-containing protein n=1 Tax=Desulfotalea psychrophila (strain LSv54 / DSM 12343) TaxID=177439 RepID=Q6ASC2_DESPS|nr:endonuclease domain-containing protein [Desulfotalea psychrophila]CAG34741.1 conserved hypothetical protein [Desulfotalea psychrophila LSv54]
MTTSKRAFTLKKHKTLRQKLRNNLTPSERGLWLYLRRKGCGCKFRRQHSIGRYVVDFYCHELKLVIEVDGDSHFQSGAVEHDQQREDFLKSLGLTILHYTNVDVLNNGLAVAENIATKVELLQQK